MKLLLVFAIVACAVQFAEGQQTASTASDNPFFKEFPGPFQTPPFNLIAPKHYLPAFKEGIRRHLKEIDRITSNTDAPTFQNTVEAMATSGRLLEKVNSVFFALLSANTSDELQQIAKEVTPLLSKHASDINLNEKLFQRVKIVYEQKQSLHLNTEQERLLVQTYKGFVRGGANLSAGDKNRFRKINDALSMLSLKFGDNLLAETNAFRLVIDKPEDLDGLPADIIEGAAELARQEHMTGKWIFTTQKPSMLPFLQYAKNRALREKLYRAYFMRGDNKNDHDNTAVVSEIAALRVEAAHLLGYKNYASYVDEEKMAKTPEAVINLLNQVWNPALKAAKRERDEMQAIIDREGGGFKLASWDWWYYAEKVRKEKYDLDETALRPYFPLDNVRQGAFDVAEKLYGLKFIELKDIPVYNKEMKVFEVRRAGGTFLGIFYTDYFPRSNKRAGAWCDVFRSQERIGDKFVTPIVFNVCNLTRPSGSDPALLSLEDVTTLFHEFGHALHSLLQDVTYKGLSIPNDFVELPSQIMERWAMEPQVLKMYARHYKTGEPIPQELIDKIERSGKFNQGFATVEYIAASYLDMDWHTLTDTVKVDTDPFEQRSHDAIHLIPEILSRYRSTYFAHIFSGDYYAGYYSYLWADVLVDDAFALFKKKGIFDRTTADKFRISILERGGAEDAAVMYRNFRGADASIRPLLETRGFLDPSK